MGFDIGDFLMGSEGVAGGHGIDYQQLDVYEDVMPMRHNQVDYLTSLLNWEQPVSMTNYLDSLLNKHKKALNQYYFGGGSSIMNLASDIGANLGLNQGELSGIYSGYQMDLGNRVQDLPSFYDKISMDYLSQGAPFAAQTLSKLPTTMPYVASGYQYAPQSGGPGLFDHLAKFGGKAAGAAIGGGGA